MSFSNNDVCKYKLSRKGRKLPPSDEKTLIALPKDVPERTWAEVFEKEENDLFLFEIREEILEESIRIVYERYMARQSLFFTVQCAADAWLQLIDWQFYRHDPGEDPSAFPPCYIPKRIESWTTDDTPSPSPKDSWSHNPVEVEEEVVEEELKKWPSSSSIDVPVIEEIPEKYWFPGKIHQPSKTEDDQSLRSPDDDYRKRPLIDQSGLGGVWVCKTTSSESLSWISNNEILNEIEENLQKITDYDTEEGSLKEVKSKLSGLKVTTPVHGLLHGAGDSTVMPHKKRTDSKSKQFSKSKVLSRMSRGRLTPLQDSYFSIMSDCRLRNLRVDTEYELTSEKLESENGVKVKLVKR